MPAVAPKRTSQPVEDKRLAAWKDLVVGQGDALDRIWPYIDVWEGGLAASERPAGVFMLVGPTGTGKGHAVEKLAEVLHGDSRNYLRVDCGEFQMEHEVAKLIGAPPGYLGHRETQPMLSAAKLKAISSDCNLSIVLFDEIEKAAGSMQRILLGILDKGTLRLGDNTTVNFEKTLIFLSSNLGARKLSDAVGEQFGLAGAVGEGTALNTTQALSITTKALRAKFTPEFINRLDEILLFTSLTREDFRYILRARVDDFNVQLEKRLEGVAGPFPPYVTLASDAEEWLLDKGFSKEYGARELKRTLFREMRVKVARALREKPKGLYELRGTVWGGELGFVWVKGGE